jgi:hypothetical protein
VFVRWFFIVGGIAFLVAALYLRERPGENASSIALTLGLIGFFWAGPQLLMMAVKRWRS